LLATLSVFLAAGTSGASDADVEHARVLDQQGVRAYREERYNDAIRYFEEARRLGGPASEVWNIARCHVHLDESEEAAKVIEEYLGLKGLSPTDRAEAEQQLHELQHRHSTLTVASSPGGATVYLEGHKWAGVTPATMDVAPGDHVVTIEQSGYDSYSRSITAKFGRAIILDAHLSKNDSVASGLSSPDHAGPHDDAAHGPFRPHRLTLDAELAVMLPQYGAVGGSASPAAFFHVAYVGADTPRYVASVGALAMLTEDGWSNTQGLSNGATNCSASIPESENATAFSVFLDGAVAWRASHRWRLGGDVGLGLATYGLSEAGGDLFVATCRPSPGVKPALHLSLQASYAISRELRILLSPFYFEVQPAFDGARAAPKDAASAWVRLGAAAGIAFDLL
jgi:hypothetical protein